MPIPPLPPILLLLQYMVAPTPLVPTGLPITPEPAKSELWAGLGQCRAGGAYTQQMPDITSAHHFCTSTGPQPRSDWSTPRGPIRQLDGWKSSTAAGALCAPTASTMRLQV